MMGWQLVVLFQMEVIKMSTQSIAGVTYMDHFDFEKRYRDVHECDPFYWHPLHLPDHCAEMYEKLISSRIASRTPVRIVKERDDIYKLNYNPAINAAIEPNYSPMVFDAIVPNYNPFMNAEVVPKYRLTPYEKMFAYIKRDITRHPKAPTIEVMPNFGPVAVYKQPISKRSEVMIKKIAQAYADVLPGNADSDEFHGHIDVKSSNKVNNDTIHEITLNSQRKKPIKITNKLKNGHIVTIKQNNK